ncbi:TrkA C-terminal domain-containing protein, partial [Streptomyces scabiei]
IEENHISNGDQGVKISANIRVRAFKLNKGCEFIGNALTDFDKNNQGLIIEEVVRDGKMLAATTTTLQENDTILVVG